MLHHLLVLCWRLPVQTSLSSMLATMLQGQVCSAQFVVSYHQSDNLCCSHSPPADIHARRFSPWSGFTQVTAVMLKTISGVAAASRLRPRSDGQMAADSDSSRDHFNGSGSGSAQAASDRQGTGLCFPSGAASAPSTTSACLIGHAHQQWSATEHSHVHTLTCTLQRMP